MTRAARKDMVNIGFFAPDYQQEFRSYKQRIKNDNGTFRFECDHEMPDAMTRYGRWMPDA